MGNHYSQQSMDEYNESHWRQNYELSSQEIGRLLNRPLLAVTFKIELSTVGNRYETVRSVHTTLGLQWRGMIKFKTDSLLLSQMIGGKAMGSSPVDVAGRLRQASPDDRVKLVIHDTIYCAIYALPRSALRFELIDQLRRPYKARISSTWGQQRCDQLQKMTSIHLVPIEVATELNTGYEGELINSSRNCGPLLVRRNHYLVMSKLRDCTSEVTFEALTCKFRHVTSRVRKTLSYDPGKEMACHEMLIKRLKTGTYFSDPNGRWQGPTNENTNDLIRSSLARFGDCSILSSLPQYAFTTTKRTPAQVPWL